MFVGFAFETPNGHFVISQSSSAPTVAPQSRETTATVPVPVWIKDHLSFRRGGKNDTSDKILWELTGDCLFFVIVFDVPE